MDPNKIAAKLLTTGVSLAAGWVATKAIGVGWKAVTGEDAPDGSNVEEDESVSIPKIVIFSVITAGVSSLINVATTRAINRAMGRQQDSSAEGSKKKKKSLGSAEV